MGTDPTPPADPGQDPAEQPVDPAARDAEPGTEPTPGDQGEAAPSPEQDATPSGGLNPDQAVRTSAAPPEAQSGVPAIPDGSNEGVEPGTPGPVEPGASEPSGEPGGDRAESTPSE